MNFVNGVVSLQLLKSLSSFLLLTLHVNYCFALVFWFTACLKLFFFICYLLCRDLVCPFTNRINIDPRKSPKLSRATQEISRSPRLPIRKPSIGSPSLTRREFPLDDITQVSHLCVQGWGQCFDGISFTF